MSHFVAVVLVAPPEPRSGEELRQMYADGKIEVEEFERRLERAMQDPKDLEGLLAPYDESTEVSPYEKPCWCVGRIAESESRDAVLPGLVEVLARREELRAELNGLVHELLRTPQGKEVGAPWVTVGEHVATVIANTTSTPALEVLREREATLAEEWFAGWAEEEAARRVAIEQHPKFGKPQHDCDECQGSGVETVTYNPNGRWDWYQVGGRWTGMLTPDYDPDLDPRNKEICIHCADHPGKRYWREEQTVGELDSLTALSARTEGGVSTVLRPTTAADPLAKEKACSACDGTGVAKKWPTEWAQHEGDVQPVGHFLSLLAADSNVLPFALVTPDGEWHQQGQMGWFGMASDEMPREQWAEFVRAAVATVAERQPDASAVVVDCHS